MMANVITIDFQITQAERKEMKSVMILPAKKGAKADRPKSVTRGLFGWALFGAVAVLFFVVLQHKPRGNQFPSQTEDESAQWTMGMIIGATGFGLGTAMFAAGLLAARLSRRWLEGHLKPRYSFGEKGIIKLYGGKQEVRPWESIHSFAETKNLFIVRTLPSEGEGFPKRLFGDEQTVARVRELLTAKIADRAPGSLAQRGSAGGFEVGGFRSDWIAEESDGPDEELTANLATPSIEFQLIGEDFERFSDHRRQILRRFRARRLRGGAQEMAGLLILLAMVGGLVLAFASSLYLSIAHSSSWTVVATFSGVFALVFVMAVVKSLSRRALGKKSRERFERYPRNALPIQVLLTDAEFIYWAGQVRYRLSWHEVVGIIDVDGLIAVVDGDVTCYLIPRRAFASNEIRDQFMEAVSARKRAPPGASAGA